MKRFIVALLLLIAFVTVYSQEPSTRYDYSQVAAQITQGCSNDYDKAEAIYRWLARNIAYDTTYSIYHADECWDNRRGVCQAYCELFYHLGKCVGLECQIVSGRTRKDNSKAFDDMGHAWLFVITNQSERQGILIDPTWGAGSVNDGVFERKDSDMSWFHVDPKWMIFTHLPNEQHYQFLETPLTDMQFLNLPNLTPVLGEYGFSAEDFLSRSLAGDVDFPELVQTAGLPFKFESVPLDKEMRVGQKYRISLHLSGQAEAFITGDGVGVQVDQWQRNGGLCWVDYMPSAKGVVSVCVRNAGESKGVIVASYSVPTPSAQDMQALAKENPFLMPEFEQIGVKYPSQLAQFGLDGHDLLQKIRSGEITSLPDLYGSEKFKVITIPMTSQLRVGTAYDFKISLNSGSEFAVINGDYWDYEWQNEGNGIYSIKVVPENGGEFSVGCKNREGGYSTIIRYRVAQPTKDDYARLATVKPYAMPEVKNMEGLRLFREYGGDSFALLKAVQNGTVDRLPKFYTVNVPGYAFRMVDVPLGHTLQNGSQYTFRVKLPSLAQLALIPSMGEWARSWVAEGNNIYSITYTPSVSGKLKLSVQFPDGKYYTFIEYDVR